MLVKTRAVIAEKVVAPIGISEIMILITVTMNIIRMCQTFESSPCGVGKYNKATPNIIRGSSNFKLISYFNIYLY